MPDRRLCLIRHAKAGDGSPDVTRRLTERGIRDARALGVWLAGQGIVPDHVILSPAARARETWSSAVRELPASAPEDIQERIYDNTAGDVLDAIRASPADVRTLAVVGHNPSFHALAERLSAGSADPVAAELRVKFPTCATAVFSVASEWADVDAATVSLAAYVVPRA
jgi:phosphohistidine phosphatase